MSRDREDPILKRADEIGAFMLSNGEAEFVDRHSPLSAMLEAEGAMDVDEVRAEALADVMRYLFGAGPHPATVMLRFYLLAERAAPTYCAHLSPLDRVRLTTNTEAAKAWRIGVLLAGTHCQTRKAVAHDRIVRETLFSAAVWRPTVNVGEPMGLGHVTEQRRGEHAEAFLDRWHATQAALTFFFMDGPGGKETTIRAFMLAKVNYENLILHMNVRKLGALFGVTGASWSGWIKRKYSRFLEARHAGGAKANFQKSPDACASYARAQRGNRNRRGLSR